MGGRYVVIYTLLNAKGEPYYYIGGNPLQPTWPDTVDPDCRNVREVWHLVPEPLKSFYETVHDGFYNFDFGDRGFGQLSEVVCLGDELDSDWRERFSGSYAFYLHQSTIVCLAVDLNGPHPGRADMWYNDDDPRLDVDFWEKVEQLAEIALDDG